MLRKVASKILWLGRATSTVLGLAVILALILGVATVAVGATSKAVPFNLGQINTSNAVSTLVGAVSGSNVKIENTNTDPNANPTALELKVPPGKAPLKVNSDAGRAENLDADKLDEWDSSDFVRKGIDAGGDLAGTYPNPDIGQGTVGSAEVSDGNLDIGDVAESAIVQPSSVAFLAVPGQTCNIWNVAAPNADVGDLVVVNPPVDMPPNIVVYPIGVVALFNPRTEETNHSAQWRFCNISSSDTTLKTSDSWKVAIFDDGNDTDN